MIDTSNNTLWTKTVRILRPELVHQKGYHVCDQSFKQNLKQSLAEIGDHHIVIPCHSGGQYLRARRYHRDSMANYEPSPPPPPPSFVLHWGIGKNRTYFHTNWGMDILRVWFVSIVQNCTSPSAPFLVRVKYVASTLDIVFKDPFPGTSRAVFRLSIFGIWIMVSLVLCLSKRLEHAYTLSSEGGQN